MTAQLEPAQVESVVLYHYFEQAVGPFRNLSALTDAEAALVTARIQSEGLTFASKRSSDYMVVRRELEQRARTMFVQKGGQPACSYPHTQFYIW